MLERVGAQGAGARLLPLKDVLSDEPGSGPFKGSHYSLDFNLHSPERRLIELRIEHADLDALIDRVALERPLDEMTSRRLKKRRLAMRDQIAHMQLALEPKVPA